MKEIFKRIENKKWNWFGMGISKLVDDEMENDIGMVVIYTDLGDDLSGVTYHSLADLLANSSWCKAVWGEEQGQGYETHWEYLSTISYKILRDDGEKACIEYIKKTML